MSSSLVQLSDQLADAVARAGQSVVSVIAHPRSPASGIHWQPGVLVTTDHTLKQQTTAEVTTPDGASHTVSLAGSDPTTGIAVLRLEGLAALPVLGSPGAEGVRPGHIALAVGRSRRAGVTATMGVLSSAGPAFRTWHGGRIDRALHLDTGLHPSGHGGAIVDVSARLIGLATSGFTRFGATAIPVETVARVVSALIEKGYIPRGYLGVGLRPVELPAAMAQQLEQPAESALILLSVEPGSAAAAAGLVVGDVLCSLGETPTREPADVQSVLAAEAIGSTIVASVFRGGTLLRVPLTIGEKER